MIQKLITQYEESRLASFGVTFGEFVFNLFQKALAGHQINKAVQLFHAYETITFE